MTNEQAADETTRSRAAVLDAVESYRYGSIARNSGIPREYRDGVIVALTTHEAAIEAKARAEVLAECQGQDGDGIFFMVRVGGIGARPDSPAKIASALVRAWSRHYVDWPVGCTPTVDVRTYEAERGGKVDTTTTVSASGEGMIVELPPSDGPVIINSPRYRP